MVQVALVADDLTGALDTAATWTRFGLRTIVMLGAASLPHTESVAMHTASRAATTTQAYRRAREAARPLRHRCVYKKVDSTLRGNIGAEIDGLLDGLGLQKALLAPALPAAGRTVEEGILRVHGVPLTETEFFHDAVCPARESCVPTLMARQTRRSVSHLPLEVIRQGEESIRRALQDCTTDLMVADAVEMGHLHALARAALHMPQPWLCCGSAGLGEGWIEALGFERSAKLLHWTPRAGPVLVVAGSRHPATARQLREAQAHRGLDLVCLSPKEEADGAEWSHAWRILAEGRHMALTTTFSPYSPGEEVDAVIHLGQAAARVCANMGILGLILTGGDTADAVCGAMGMAAMQVVGEVQPGIPAARGIGGQGDGLRLVTKAGGFGHELALVQCIDFIQGMES